MFGKLKTFNHLKAFNFLNNLFYYILRKDEEFMNGKKILTDDRPNGRVRKYAFLFVRIFFFENQIIKLFGLAKKIEFIYTVKTLYTCYVWSNIFHTWNSFSDFFFFYYYYYFEFWPPYNIYFLGAHPATLAAAGGP